MNRSLSLALMLITLILVTPVSAEDGVISLSKVKINIPAKYVGLAPPPLILKDKVIVACGKGLSEISAYSFDGKLLWTKGLGSRVYYLVSVKPNLIAFLEGKALILSSKNGAVLGTIKLDSPLAAQPLYDLSSNELFLPTESGYLEAMSGLSIGFLWRRKLDSPPLQVLDAGDKIITITQKELYCFLKSGGNKLWERKLSVRTAGVGPGYVVILTEDHKLVYLSSVDGTKKAELPLSSKSYPSGPIVTNGDSVFLVSLGGGMYRFFKMRLVDEGFLGLWPASQPLQVEDLLFVLGSDGRIKVLEAHFGKVIWSLSTGVSPSKTSVSSEGGFAYLCLLDEGGELLIIRTPLVKFSGTLEITEERRAIVSGELTLLTSEGGNVFLYLLDPTSNRTISTSLGKFDPSFSKHVDVRLSIPEDWPAVLVGFSVNNRRLGALLNKTYVTVKPNESRMNASKTNVTEEGTLKIFMKETSIKMAVGTKRTVSLDVVNTLNTDTFLVDASSSGKVIKVMNSPNVLTVNKGSTAHMDIEVLAVSPGTDTLKVILKSGNKTFERTLTFEVSKTAIIQGMTLSKFKNVYLLNIRVKNTVQDNATFLLSVYTNENKMASVKISMMKKDEERNVKVQLPVKGNRFDVIAVVEVNGVKAQIVRKTFSFISQQPTLTSLNSLILMGVALTVVSVVTAAILLRRTRRSETVQPPSPEELVSDLEERAREEVRVKREETSPPHIEAPSEATLIPETTISEEEKKETSSLVELPEEEATKETAAERIEEVKGEITGEPEESRSEEVRPEVEEIEISRPEVEEEVQKVEMPPVEKAEVEEELPLERIEFVAPEDASLAEILNSLKESKARLDKLMEFERRIRGELDFDEPLFEPQLKRISETIESVRTALRAGDLNRAREELDRIDESLNTIETKMKSGERVLINNWDAVEKRIGVMLRVWGRAPATMITMVPQELRVAALKIYMKRHPEAEWELVGDELRKRE